MKFFSALLLISYCTINLSAQSKTEAADAPSYLWFGLDFSQARFIGKHEFKTPEELKERFIPAWNQLMLAEPEKYNIAEFFHKMDVKSDFGDVYRGIKSIDENEIILGIDGLDYEIPEAKIQEIVSNYITEYEGYGLVFIIDNFNKLNVIGSMWVTIFHIPTKTVVFTKRVSAEPAGFGLKNYWAGSIYEVMNKCSESIDIWLKE